MIRSTQWAAVRTCLRSMRVPAQLNRNPPVSGSKTCRVASQGKGRSIGWPCIVRVRLLFRPGFVSSDRSWRTWFVRFGLLFNGVPIGSRPQKQRLSRSENQIKHFLEIVVLNKNTCWALSNTPNTILKLLHLRILNLDEFDKIMGGVTVTV